MIKRKNFRNLKDKDIIAPNIKDRGPLSSFANPTFLSSSDIIITDPKQDISQILAENGYEIVKVNK